MGADGRQIAVEMLDKNEILSADDLILQIRPWCVHEGRLFPTMEHVVAAHTTLAEFRTELQERLCDMVSVADEDEEDVLEACIAPPGPLGLPRCAALLWSESTLNCTDVDAVPKLVVSAEGVQDGASV